MRLAQSPGACLFVATRYMYLVNLLLLTYYYYCMGKTVKVKTVKLETEFNVVGLVSVCCWSRFRCAELVNFMCELDPLFQDCPTSIFFFIQTIIFTKILALYNFILFFYLKQIQLLQVLTQSHVFFNFTLSKKYFFFLIINSNLSSISLILGVSHLGSLNFELGINIYHYFFHVIIRLKFQL